MGKFQSKIPLEKILLSQEILYKVPLGIDNSVILNEIDSLKKEDPEGVRYSNSLLGWQSNPTKTTNNKYFSSMSKEIGNVVSDIFNKSFITTRTHINISPKYSYNSYHGHPDSDLVGVLYVQTPKDCGNLRIFDPLEHHVNINISPQSLYLYIFSSYLFHEVGTNANDQERISIAFNFNKNQIDE
tara:strand:+ start:453 stop:1007 length:555 start_codon:yes stop_codon:yes gene_type:complete